MSRAYSLLLKRKCGQVFFVNANVEKIPVLLANGRISQKSVNYRYQKVVFFCLSNGSRKIYLFFQCVTQKDANRLLSLGVDPEESQCER